MSETVLNLEILRNGLKLDHSVDNLFMKSIVYDFLRRKVNAEIANEFKLLYGPFTDLNGLTLEELFGMYKKKFKDISTNPVSSTSQKLKIYHFDVASQFKNLVGGLEDVRGELTIEELFVMYKKKFKVIFTNLLVRFRPGL